MNWIILLTTFGILFLGELGDKTQLIVFNLTLEHEKSYKISIGSTIGFAIIVTIGVFFGVVITTYGPLSLITLISGIVFIIIGILGIPRIRKIYREKHNVKHPTNEIQTENTASRDDPIPSRLSNLKKNIYLAGFLFIFVMELGDKTQILTITLASVYNAPVEVRFGSFLALISLAWMGVFFGAIITNKVPKLYLKFMSMIIFISIGIVPLITLII